MEFPVCFGFLQSFILLLFLYVFQQNCAGCNAFQRFLSVILSYICEATLYFATLQFSDILVCRILSCVFSAPSQPTNIPATSPEHSRNVSILVSFAVMAKLLFSWGSYEEKHLIFFRKFCVFILHYVIFHIK